MTEEEQVMKIHCLLQKYEIAKKQKDFKEFEFCQEYVRQINE